MSREAALRQPAHSVRRLLFRTRRDIAIDIGPRGGKTLLTCWAAERAAERLTANA